MHHLGEGKHAKATRKLTDPERRGSGGGKDQIAAVVSDSITLLGEGRANKMYSVTLSDR